MRAASPTGGALGNVTERELALLQATLGSLSTELPPEKLAETLVRVGRVTADIVYGTDAQLDLAVEQGHLTPAQADVAAEQRQQMADALEARGRDFAGSQGRPRRRSSAEPASADLGNANGISAREFAGLLDQVASNPNAMPDERTLRGLSDEQLEVLIERRQAALGAGG